MATNPPEDESRKKDTPPGADANPAEAAATDEDVLKLRGRLDREFAVLAQKLADAEAAIQEIEATLRSYESQPRSRPSAAASSSSSEKGTERISSRFKAVGDVFSRIKGSVTGKDESAEPAATPKPADASSGPRTFRDLEDRLGELIEGMGGAIRERERESVDFDRKLHEAQKDLIRHRANEQHLRDMQIKMGQTKHLSDELERKRAALDEMMKSFESASKPDAAAKPKPAAPAPPKIEDKLQTAIDEALKAIGAQEKKVADLEKDLEKAQGALVEERTRQQRVRALQVRLRQVRHFSSDLQRGLGGLASSIEDMRRRAGSLLRPTSEAPKPGRAPEAAKPAAPRPAPAEASASKPPSS
jgi:hypothetical protein